LKKLNSLLLVSGNLIEELMILGFNKVPGTINLEKTVDLIINRVT